MTPSRPGLLAFLQGHCPILVGLFQLLLLLQVACAWDWVGADFPGAASEDRDPISFTLEEAHGQ